MLFVFLLVEASAQVAEAGKEVTEGDRITALEKSQQALRYRYSEVKRQIGQEQLKTDSLAAYLAGWEEQLKARSDSVTARVARVSDLETGQDILFTSLKHRKSYAWYGLIAGVLAILATWIFIWQMNRRTRSQVEETKEMTEALQDKIESLNQSVADLRAAEDRLSQSVRSEMTGLRETVNTSVAEMKDQAAVQGKSLQALVADTKADACKQFEDGLAGQAGKIGKLEQQLEQLDKAFTQLKSGLRP